MYSNMLFTVTLFLKLGKSFQGFIGQQIFQRLIDDLEHQAKLPNFFRKNPILNFIRHGLCGICGSKMAHNYNPFYLENKTGETADSVLRPKWSLEELAYVFFISLNSSPTNNHRY